MRVVRVVRRGTKASVIGAFSALAVFGCSEPIGIESDSTEDPILAGPQFSGTGGTVGDLQDAAANGPVRVEINIGQLDPNIVARKVEIESPDELGDKEEIRGAVAAAQSTDGAGSLQLVLGGLAIDFDADTRLRIDETKEEPGVASFVDYVNAELSAGRVPFVRVKRRPEMEAQAPDDATFRADEIRVREKSGKTRIKLLIDSDNLRMNDAPPPDAFLLVLGLEIHVNVTDGVTEIDDDDHDGDFVKFEDKVTGVDPDALTATLGSGTIIQLDDKTKFDDCDDDDGLCSLAEVRDALDAGFTVKAEGKGTIVEGAEVRTIVAREVEFEIEDDDDDDCDDCVEFEGMVVAADPDALTATLGSGTIIQLDDKTKFDDCDDYDEFCSLAEVRDALDAGFTVKAEGKGTIVEGAEVRTILAREVEFEIEDDDDCDDCVEFEGMVVAADPDALTATLGSGTIIQLDDKTKFDDCDDYDEFCSLTEVRDALDAGYLVKAKGKGTVVEDAEAYTILAREVEFEREDNDDPDHVEFENTLADIDVDARTVTLGDGTLVQLDDKTEIKQPGGDHHLGSLEAAASAHQAGATVRVKGKGTVVDDDPRTILASEIELRTES